MDDSSPMMGDSSDMSVNSEYLNTSVSSDDQQQHVKPLKIKISSPAVTPKMEKMLGVGKSVTIINSPQQLSRASSSMSLASASNSMAAEEVRSFSNNYEQLLQQATVSIRRLTRDKAGLEAEQDRLLNVNIDLATEVKRLLALDKENKAERKGLMAANEEFASEVKFAPVPWRPDGSSVVEACKASAARLGLETVPLYQIHWPDVIQPFKAFGQENRKDELYWDGLAECYLSGLAENVGVSNYGSETLLRAHEALSKRGVPLVSNQINLSLLRYRSSEATVRTCEDLGVKVLAYFPLANGLLAGKYDEKPPSFPKSVTMKKYMDDTSPLLFILRRIAQERGKTVAQVSINWVMMKGAIPIPGARSATMARENFGSMGWALTDDEVLELEAAAANVMEFSSGGFELV